MEPVVQHRATAGAVALELGVDAESRKLHVKELLAASWKNFVEDVRERGTGTGESKTEVRIAFCCAAAMFWSTAITMLYTTLQFTIDDALSELPTDWRYAARLLVVFGFVNACANWLLTALTDTAFRPSSDRPQLRKTLFEPFPAAPARQLLDDGDKYMQYYAPEPDTGLQWRRCRRCLWDAPPRTRHCPVCRLCVLKRDHHCYLTGTCVGFHNQRFFVVLVFYVSLACALGGGGSAYYLWRHYHAASWWDLLLPYQLYLWAAGRLAPHLLFMLYHCHVFWWIGPMCAFFFAAQWGAILQGKTTFEDAKQVPIVCRQPLARRVESVFGKFFLLNFIFPAVVLYKQQDDGAHWWDTYHVGNLRQQPKHCGVVCDSVKTV